MQHTYILKLNIISKTILLDIVSLKDLRCLS